MGVMASQDTDSPTVCLAVYPGYQQRKRKNSGPLLREFTILTQQGLALLTLSWDKNWDSHSLVNGYPSFYPRIALVAPGPGEQLLSVIVETTRQNLLSMFRWQPVYQEIRRRSHIGIGACEKLNLNYFILYQWFQTSCRRSGYISQNGEILHRRL